MSTGIAEAAPLEPRFGWRWVLDDICMRGASRGVGLPVFLSES